MTTNQIEKCLNLERQEEEVYSKNIVFISSYPICIEDIQKMGPGRIIRVKNKCFGDNHAL